MVNDQRAFLTACIISSLGIAINILGVFAHVYAPVLLKHPGSLLLMHIVCQCFYLSHWLIAYPQRYEYFIYRDISNRTCEQIAMFTSIFYYASWVYILSLCSEIFIILKYKAYKTSKIRLVLYNISAFLFSVLLMIMYYFLDSLGLSEVGSCFIKMSSVGELIDAVLNFCLTGLLIFSYYLIRKQLGCCYGPAFRILSKVVLVMCVTIVLSRVSIIIIYIQRGNSDHVAAYTIILGSTTSIIWGTSAAISRSLHPKVISKIKALCGEESTPKEPFLDSKDFEREEVMKSILNFTLDGEADDIADAFDNLGHKILIQILVLLTIRFREEKDSTQTLREALENNLKHPENRKYPETNFISLAYELQMPFIVKVFCPDISLLEFNSNIFQCIKSSTGFTKDLILDSLLSYENLKAISSINNKGGRSNSFFFTSANQKIIIKTITAEEKNSLLKFLPSYSKRVVEQPQSKLVRILGLFEVLPHKQDFIIMENSIPNRDSCHIFDLKGSTVNRHVGGVDSENPPTGLVLKDLNFKRWNNKILLQNPSEVIKHIVDDMKLLKKHKLMDYSMLLGVYQNPSVQTRYFVSSIYSISIIDFLQRYGTRKSLERVWKRYFLRKTEGISVISPIRYYKRITKYLKSIIEHI
ncbi:hypothetical protein SteCoe_20178 [Stentor coeruleus]|uniref:PIPK domain-containing protein n=1 Tax=Stentor coeruleus TaxID=5963 RepID=A0A1R2BSM1_9CILI|nr:hypothetical protein SteCoe_20178 [Stentor coeruleus]